VIHFGPQARSGRPKTAGLTITMCAEVTGSRGDGCCQTVTYAEAFALGFRWTCTASGALARVRRDRQVECELAWGDVTPDA
jgi:hypothetical protein